MAGHCTHVYTTREAYLASLIDTQAAKRRGMRTWANHVRKHGNAPMVVKCTICHPKGSKRPDIQYRD